MAGHAKAKTDRCPSWRQLYRITCTLSELAGIEAPKTAAAASELIGRLDTLAGAEPAAVTVTRGADCDDIPF
jgi:hypothetical protein